VMDFQGLRVGRPKESAPNGSPVLQQRNGLLLKGVVVNEVKIEKGLGKFCLVAQPEGLPCYSMRSHRLACDAKKVAIGGCTNFPPFCPIPFNAFTCLGGGRL